jgi:hypothetical protein
LNDDQLFELREAGREAAEEQLEELDRKLKELKSRFSSQLPPDVWKAVDEAQRWFTYQCIPESETICRDILNQNILYGLELKNLEVKRFYWEIGKYLLRISDSLFHENYTLLEGRLLKPSLPHLAVYSEVLDCIRERVPPHLTLKEEVKARIDYLKNMIIRHFGCN